MALYRELNHLAKQFLVEDVDHPELNRNLLDRLGQRFYLCDEFKRIYVYAQTLSDEDRERLKRQLPNVEGASSEQVESLFQNCTISDSRSSSPHRYAPVRQDSSIRRGTPVRQDSSILPTLDLNMRSAPLALYRHDIYKPRSQTPDILPSSITRPVVPILSNTNGSQPFVQNELSYQTFHGIATGVR